MLGVTERVGVLGLGGIVVNALLFALSQCRADFPPRDAKFTYSIADKPPSEVHIFLQT
jgi:hypothetical protein